MKIVFYKATSQGVTFPCAIFCNDGILIDSRSGEPCRNAESYNIIDAQEFETLCADFDLL